MKTPLRDAVARQAVIRQLAKAHDRFAEDEQLLKSLGKHVEAEGAHVMAVRILRAYAAEMDDEPPKFVP